MLSIPKDCVSKKSTGFNIKALVDETIREGVERSAFAINTESKYELVKRMIEAGLREFVLGISPENTELLSRCLERRALGDFANDTKFIFIALLNSWETTFHYLQEFPKSHLKDLTLSFGMINLQSQNQLFESVFDKFLKIGIESFKVSILCNFAGGIEERRYEEIVGRINRCLALGIKTVRINDSVGTLHPEVTEVLCRNLVYDFPGVDFCLHSHNDRGLALINSLTSIYYGFNMIEGSLGGLGNRAGLPSIELIDKICKEKEISFGNCQLDSKQIIEASQFADEIFMNIPNVFRPVSGLFVNNVNVGVLNIPDYLGVQGEKEYILNASALHPKTVRFALQKAGFDDKELEDEEFITEMTRVLKENLESIYLQAQPQYHLILKDIQELYTSSSLTIEQIKEVALKLKKAKSLITA